MESADSIISPALRSTSSLALRCSSSQDTNAETAMPAANTSVRTMLNLSLRPMDPLFEILSPRGLPPSDSVPRGLPPDSDPEGATPGPGPKRMLGPQSPYASYYQSGFNYKFQAGRRSPL